jgi:energy-coupling factor transport system substrate-specific component
VSWQLGILLILGVTLLGGAAWYERSRPPSQVVALVAALAALAVAGRVALSPIPNVVPTTDIVLLAGYALGGAPGFAVGALSGLVSNFWLGQGPWTPWQMAGWGMTGLLGAALAAASGRRVGRIGLAVVCAAAGFAYGALLDLSLMVTYGGEQSLDRFLALSARGLPFNIAHAAGNATLALVAGPALVRMLLRYRRRFEFAWGRRSGARVPGRRAVAASLLVALVAISGLIGRAAPVARTEAAAPTARAGSAVAWLKGAQNSDGGFGIERGSDSSTAITGWAVLGLEAAGWNPLDLDAGDANPISYLRGTAGEIRTTGDIERTILVVRGAGLDPTRFGGRNLIARLRARRGPDGSWGGQVNLTAFGILALDAAGLRSGNARSAGWLRRSRNPDGGWGLAPGTESDPDSTGAALQALGRAGGGDAIRDGVEYLRSAQRPGGGFALAYGGPVNAQSTAWAVQGLIAAGVSPSKVRSGGRSPLDYLSSRRAADGHYRYSASSDQTPVWVTGQVLAAISGEAFPIDPVSRRGGAAKEGSSSAAAAPAPDRSAEQPAAKKSAKRKAKPAKENSPAGGGAAIDPTPAPLDPASGDDDSGGGGDGDALPWIAGGILILAAGVGGGWLLYRRRLPG